MADSLAGPRPLASDARQVHNDALQHPIGTGNAEHPRTTDQRLPPPHDQVGLAPGPRHPAGPRPRGENGRPHRPQGAAGGHRSGRIRRREGHVVRGACAVCQGHDPLPAWGCLVHPPAGRVSQAGDEALGADRHARAAAGLPTGTGAPVPRGDRRLPRDLPLARGTGLRGPATGRGGRFGRRQPDARHAHARRATLCCRCPAARCCCRRRRT